MTNPPADTTTKPFLLRNLERAAILSVIFPGRTLRLALGAALVIAALLFAVLWAAESPASVQAQTATEAPAKPTGLKVDPTAGSLAVSVDWDDVPGADEYEVRWRLHGPNQGAQSAAYCHVFGRADHCRRLRQVGGAGAGVQRCRVQRAGRRAIPGGSGH